MIVNDRNSKNSSNWARSVQIAAQTLAKVHERHCSDNHVAFEWRPQCPKQNKIKCNRIFWCLALTFALNIHSTRLSTWRWILLSSAPLAIGWFAHFLRQTQSRMHQTHNKPQREQLKEDNSVTGETQGEPQKRLATENKPCGWGIFKLCHLCHRFSKNGYTSAPLARAMSCFWPLESTRAIKTSLYRHQIKWIRLETLLKEVFLNKLVCWHLGERCKTLNY